MSILMFVMCISFLGNGIKELIEGGLISATNLGWFQQNEVLSILGIYPIAETLFPQIILVIITIITFIVQIKRNRKLAAESDGKDKAKSKAKAKAGEKAGENAEAKAESGAGENVESSTPESVATETTTEVGSTEG